MALNINGLDRGDMPPADIFPQNRHDAELEWTIAKKILFPMLKAVILFVLGAVSLGIANGYIVGPWKTELERHNASQNLAVQELRLGLQSLSEKSDRHDQILYRLDNFASNMTAAVSRIEGRLSPLSQSVQPPALASAPLPAAPVASRPVGKKHPAQPNYGWSVTN